MKQKTAMQEMIEKINTLIILNGVSEGLLNLKHYAKTLLTTEREQIEEAYDAGLKTKTGIQTDDFKWGGKYYQQKYGDEK